MKNSLAIGCQTSDKLKLNSHFLHTRVGDSRCVSKWYTTYVGDRFSEVCDENSFALNVVKVVVEIDLTKNSAWNYEHVSKLPCGELGI